MMKEIPPKSHRLRTVRTTTVYGQCGGFVLQTGTQDSARNEKNALLTTNPSSSSSCTSATTARRRFTFSWRLRSPEKLYNTCNRKDFHGLVGYEISRGGSYTLSCFSLSP